MQKQSEIEEGILGLIMGIGIGAVIGFLLGGSERRDNRVRTDPNRVASEASEFPMRSTKH
jgi:hypothetical protein